MVENFLRAIRLYPGEAAFVVLFLLILLALVNAPDAWERDR